jgi:hypothetical protein
MGSKINKEEIITVVGETPLEDIVFDGPTFDEYMAEQEATREELTQARESGMAKLVALGLTETEARAVIGF